MHLCDSSSMKELEYQKEEGKVQYQKNEKWRLETNLNEKSEYEQKAPDEEQKASEPHTEASAEDDELQTKLMCFIRTSDKEDGGIVNREEDGDAVNREEHGGVFVCSVRQREFQNGKKN
ncbi:unnamed protein product [Lactuca virosa]|uniref:Uncharacterized protein n=1 Tax=Lactuca virosa TaxID=75947 RepID=A0AAU9MRG1_9ASTR|nr:unnamed protein product [Lactuca virosa]CAH1428417.1 unnamed protein product [Lactuca virosa]